MSRPQKKAGKPASKKQKGLGALAPRTVDTDGAEQVRGGLGVQTSGKPVARYHLENAWPSK